MRRRLLGAAILLALAGPVGWGYGQESSGPAAPGPTAREAPSPVSSEPAVGTDDPEEPLQLDLDTAISGVLTQMLATPRFEEEIEVRDRYQAALDRLQRGKSAVPEADEDVRRTLWAATGCD